MKTRLPLSPLLLAVVAPLAAQVAPPPAATPPPATAPVELSPFQVTTDRDVGYQAENSLAGSRLNTPLRDTASSLSVFTREFLDDLAVSDVSELLRYSVNGEMNTNENQAGSEQNPVVNAQSLTPSILVRGLTASLGLDYFTSIVPVDPYRAGRYEDSRGPNSILFGIGSPGGIVNQTSKVAQLGRHQYALRHSTGAWDRNRTELDVNRVLRPGKLALSLAALHQESGGWRSKIGRAHV